MALGYIQMPEGSRAPAPTKMAMKAVAKGAGDYATDWADKAAERAEPAVEKAVEAVKKAAEEAFDSIKRMTERKKD